MPDTKILPEPFAQVISAVAAGSKLRETSNIMGTGVMGISCWACSTRKESPWAFCLNPTGESLSSYVEDGDSDEVDYKNLLSEGSPRILIAPLYLQAQTFVERFHLWYQHGRVSCISYRTIILWRTLQLCLPFSHIPLVHPCLLEAFLTHETDVNIVIYVMKSLCRSEQENTALSQRPRQTEEP